MVVHPLAGKPAPASQLVNVPRLVTSFYCEHPDPSEETQLVSFGTSGHRGVSTSGSFNEDHIQAISQAVCEVRKSQGITGPLFLGMDTHALSEPALVTTLEVLVANGVEVFIQKNLGYSPTPVVSHAILSHNRGRTQGLADGIVITPSHNPPDGGGFKYNPPHGGPADTAITKAIEKRANQLLAEQNAGVTKTPWSQAFARAHQHDFILPYVEELSSVLDMDALRTSKIRIGVDPMGGASIDLWDPIVNRYGLNLEVVNRRIDPTFSFMTIDHDGKIRMDCSSPYAMASLIKLKDRFDIAFGNDTDGDRHGIVTKNGLMNPNHFLAVAIYYLFQNRPQWNPNAAIGKTLVSSAIIDRVAKHIGRPLLEVPVGFKWFVKGLSDGSYGFGGEESAGASFLRRDGTTWTTDKDGILLGLLAAEITAKLGQDPSMVYQQLASELGSPVYKRTDNAATPAQKDILKNLSPQQVKTTSLAGEPILQRITHAPGNQASIGGLKVASQNGWFAARPSGTEDIYKIYAESFLNSDHLEQIQQEAKGILQEVFQSAGV